MRRDRNKATTDEERIYKKKGLRNDAAIFSSILKITLCHRVTLFWNRNAKTSRRSQIEKRFTVDTGRRSATERG